MNLVPSWLVVLALLLAASVVVERVKAAPAPVSAAQGASAVWRPHGGR